jgi:plastocyanin
MRKILFIGLVVTAVVLVSGCYAPTTSPNATVQPTVTETPYVTETPVATATVATTPIATAVSTVTGTATVSATVATVNTVNITSAGYDPAIITVPRGTQVTWTNTDNVSHTVTSTTGNFSSSLSSGQTYSYWFGTPGSYNYSDSYNPNMSGTVVVTTGGTPGEITPTETATSVSTTTGTSPTVATVNGVKITSAGYDPAIISVKKGTVVTWTNTDNVTHTIISKTGAFNSSLVSGKTYSYTFSTTGSYDYGDPSYPKMSGTVIVT